MTTPPLERITWLDHVESEGPAWFTDEDYATLTGPAVIVTVGWVMAEHDDWLAVANCLCPADGWGSRPTVIVKSCITARITLGVTPVAAEQSHAP